MVRSHINPNLPPDPSSKQLFNKDVSEEYDMDWTQEEQEQALRMIDEAMEKDWTPAPTPTFDPVPQGASPAPPKPQPNNNDRGSSGSSKPRQRDKTKWRDIKTFTPTTASTAINKAMRRELCKHKPFEPAQWQVDVPTALLSGHDVLAISPTGSGKSLTFQLPMLLRGNSVVVAPLIELIREQVAELCEMGIAAVELTSDNLALNPEVMEDFEKGKYKVVVGSPEILLHPRGRFWLGLRKGRHKHPFWKDLKFFVIDEGHMMWKWGRAHGGDDENSGFRPDFKLIGNFRMLFPEIPMLVLSATITRPVEAYLHTTLGLQSPTLLCRRPLFRKNIQTIFIPIKKVGFEELEFLMHVVPRPTTMIYVDDRNMAQNLARYLREKLRKQGESETMVVVYTGYQDVETRVQNMEEFRIGTNVKYMVCTEAAGMGLNIRHIKVVVQFKIAKFLTLPDLTQRLGRCARDPATKGAGFVFVNDKYIIPREALDEEFNSSADGRNYFLPITPETVASGEVRKMLDSIYSEENRESGSTLDPGLMWMINTVGCRSRVQLAVLGDEASAFWFPTESETILGRIEDTNCRVHVICNCDTCILGIATKYSRLIKPPCLREGLDRPGLTPAVRDAMRRALREKHSDVVCEREEAVMKINTTVAAHGDIYGLSLKRSIGYWDTAANEEEQIKEREAKLDTRQVTTARTKELKASIISAMCQKRSCIYVHENIEMRFSLTEIFFIPTEIISKIAASEDILTCSSACFTIQFLHTIVAKTEGVKNSIFDSYLNEFHRVIRRCIVEDEQRKQRAIEEQEARRQEAEEALRLSNQEPMMDFFNRRSQSRSRSTTPLPESQTTIGESQANFRQDGNIASRTSTPLSSRNGRSTSRATTPTLQSTQEVDYSLKLNEYGKGDEFFKGQEAHSKEVVPEPVRRRVLHKLPRVRYEDLDPNNPRQMEIWRLQEEDDEYVRQQQQRKVESRLMMLKNRAERDIAKKNAAEVARKKKQLEKEGQKVTKKKGKRGVRTDTEPDRPEEQNTEAEASTASTPSQGIDIPVPLLDPAIPAPTKAKRKYKKKDTNIETVPVHGDSTTSEPPDPPKPKTKGRPRKINTASEPPSTGQQPGALRRRISMRTRLATAAGIQLPTQPEPAPTRRKRKAEPAEGSLVDTDLDASEHIM